MDLFYTISPHLATGKKKMWGLSQKIHKGSLAFFGKWDKINKIRTKPGMRREYGSPRSVCVPASQEQAFYKSCCAGPDRADRGVRPYGWHEGLCRPLWIWFIHFILHTKVRKEARFMTKIDIVSGFLGAGKTTLIKKMLAEAYKGEKLVLIENEFGEISIDGGFLKDAGVQISEMSSGCICCSLVGDFGRALVDVQKKFSPDRILIEPSGVGKLSDVILAVENTVKDVPEMKLNSFVTVADASKVKVYMKNFGEFYNNQIETAGTIILSRTQKVSPEKLQASVALLREKNQDAAIITTPWDELDGKTILAAMEKVSLADELMERIRAEHEAEEEEHHHHHHDHDHEEHDEHEHHHDHDDHDEDEEHEHHHHHDDECCHDHEHDHEHHHDHDHEEHEHHHHHDGECDDPECSCHHHHHHADEVFTSWGAETPKTFTQADIDRILAALDGGAYGAILRAKGIVPCENGKWLHFDYVPEEHEVRFGPADYTGRLCVIGSKLDEGKLKELFGL
jgi:G3E family GTPase